MRFDRDVAGPGELAGLASAEEAARAAWAAAPDDPALKRRRAESLLAWAEAAHNSLAKASAIMQLGSCDRLMEAVRP